MNKNSLQIIKYHISIIHLVLVFSIFYPSHDAFPCDAEGCETKTVFNPETQTSVTYSTIGPNCIIFEYQQTFWGYLRGISKVNFREGEPNKLGPPHFDYVMRDEKWAYPVKSDGQVIRGWIFDPSIDFFDPRFDPDFDMYVNRRFKKADGSFTPKIQLMCTIGMTFKTEPKVSFRLNDSKRTSIMCPIRLLAKEEVEFIRQWAINYSCAIKMTCYVDVQPFKYVYKEDWESAPSPEQSFHPVRGNGQIIREIWINPALVQLIDINDFDVDFDFYKKQTFTSLDGKSFEGIYLKTDDKSHHFLMDDGSVIRVLTNRFSKKSRDVMKKIRDEKMMWRHLSMSPR